MSEKKVALITGASQGIGKVTALKLASCGYDIAINYIGREDDAKEVKKECEAFGVESIHSEYGMAELTSQAYSSGSGIFRTPGWMRVLVRDVNDPFDIRPAGVRGGIDIIDLANRYSCAFIQTQDIGRVFDDGSFEIEGRIDRSDIRGCNLLVQ